MIEYDYGYWGFGHILSLKGSVLPKTLVFSLPTAVLSMILHVFSPNESGKHKDLIAGWSAYSFVLGTLLVFRINQAYARYWESATLVHQLRGRWFNSISCLFAFCTPEPTLVKEVVKFQTAATRFMSMLYCAAVQQLSEHEFTSLELLDDEGMDEASVEFLAHAADKCEVLMQWLQRTVVDAQANGVLSVSAPILAMTFGELGGGIVDLNNVRKVRDIPFPFPYAQMTMFLLVLHMVITPFMTAYVAETTIVVGLSTFISVTAYMGTYYITREIEQPFGNNENDLPLSEILKDMNDSLSTLTMQQQIRLPTFDPNVGIGAKKVDSESLRPNYAKEQKSRYSAVRQLPKPKRASEILRLRESAMELSPVMARPGLPQLRTPDLPARPHDLPSTLKTHDLPPLTERPRSPRAAHRGPSPGAVLTSPRLIPQSTASPSSSAAANRRVPEFKLSPPEATTTAATTATTGQQSGSSPARPRHVPEWTASAPSGTKSPRLPERTPAPGSAGPTSALLTEESKDDLERA